MSITRKARIARIGGAEDRRKLRARLAEEIPALELSLVTSELTASVFVDLVLPTRSGELHLVGAQKGTGKWFVFSAGDTMEQSALLDSDAAVEDIDRAFTRLVNELEVKLGLAAKKSA